MYENIEVSTNIALYAHDTKIWREINSNNDYNILQKDALYTWSKNNKISFHPDKHKDLSTYDFRPDFVKILKMGGWGNPIFSHFCPSPNPDFEVSWEKMGKMCKNGEKVYGKRGKKYSF